MPPKKYFVKFEYEDRRLKDDFLEQLPYSKEGNEANKFSRILGNESLLDLKDRFRSIADTYMSTKGLQIFRWWYKEVNTGSPLSNV